PSGRIEDQVPRPDVLDLAAAEPGLEMGDAAGREAPQGVRRGVLLSGRADRLPFQEVVRPRLAAIERHPAVWLDDPRPTADEEKGCERLPAGATGEEETRVAGGRECLPDVAIRPLRPDQEAGPVRRLAVHAVELGQRAPVGVAHRDPQVPGLVDVLPPLLAQIAPEPVLVGGQVDDPRRVRLDRRRGSPARTAQRPPRRPVLVERPVPLDLGIDSEMRDATRALGQLATDGVAERRDRIRGPDGRDRAAGSVGEGPRQGARPAGEDLGGDGRWAGDLDPFGRPAVDGLDPGPAAQLEVRAGVGRLDEAIPVGVVGRRCLDGERLGRHAPRGRRTRSSMRPIIAASSPIRNTAEIAADVRTQTTPTTPIRTIRAARPGSSPVARLRPAPTPAAARPPPIATASDRNPSDAIGRIASSGSERFSRTNRAIASSQAAIAIARPRPGRPNGPTRMAARLEFTTTARTAAATGVRVSWRA